MKIKKSGIAALAIYVIIIIAIYISTVCTRIADVDRYWKQYPDLFYVDGEALLTSADSYRWTGEANALLNSEKGSFDAKLNYPEGAGKKTFPLLPNFLVMFSKITDSNVYNAGIILIPILAGLFVIPLGIYFYVSGFPAAGILGSATGAYSIIYMGRTNAGRVDTDSLNLFFPFLTSQIILIGSKKNGKQLLLYAAMTGFSQFIFYLWYGHGLFTIAYGATLLICLAAERKNFRNIISALIIYIIFSNPYFFYQGLENMIDSMSIYIVKNNSVGDGLTNIFNTIQEAERISPQLIFQYSFINSAVFVFAISGIFLLIIKKTKVAIPLMPLMIMSLLPFISSIRFLIYTMPFLGVGLGSIIVILANKIKINENKKTYAVFALSAVLSLFFVAIPVKGLTYSSRVNVSIPPNIYKELKSFKYLLPKNSVIYSWWDNGLAITDVSGLPTFHDGMHRNGYKTWLIARSFMDLDSETIANTAAFIANGEKPEQKESSSQLAVKAKNYNVVAKNDNIYIYFTYDMLEKIQQIAYVGLLTNKTIVPDHLAHGMIILSCGNSKGSKALCEDFEIDLETGSYNNDNFFKNVVTIELASGKILSEKVLNDENLYSLVMMKNPYSDSNYVAFVMTDKTFNSSIIQMFLLGKYNNAKFEEITNNYPASRLFKIKA